MTLSEDLFQLIFSYLTIDDVYKINNSQPNTVNINTYCKYTINQCKYNMNIQSEKGYLNVIKFLHNIGKTSSTYAIDKAAEKGHLEVIIFLYTT